LGALLLGEPLTRRTALGVAVGFCGVGVVTLAGRDVGGLGPGALPGVLLGLIAALVWAACTVLTRRLAAATVDPLASTTLAALARHYQIPPDYNGPHTPERRSSGGPVLSPDQREIGLYCGSANPNLANAVAEQLGLPLGGRRLRRFADSEVHFQIEESIRGKDVFL